MFKKLYLTLEIKLLTNDLFILFYFIYWEYIYFFIYWEIAANRKIQTNLK